MTPRAWASTEVLAQRAEAVRTGSTSSHWPHGPGADEFRLADTVSSLRNCEFLIEE